MSKSTEAAPDLKLVDGKEPAVNAAGPTTLKPAEINPFDLASLVIRPTYKKADSMVTSAATIPIQEKAGPQTFFMVHPDPEYAQDMWVVKWHESGEADHGEFYIVHPSVQAAMPEEPAFREAKIYYCISQTGKEFLVVALLPLASGKKDLWLPSKHECMEAARSRFIRMNSSSKQWVYTYAETDGPESPPNWSTESYMSILMRGFKSPRQDRYVNSLNHLVVKSLKGIRPC